MLDFVGKRYWFFLFSALLSLVCIVSLVLFGLKPGIDFRSGSSMTLSFEPPVSENDLRSVLAESGYGNAVVRHTSDDDYIIRMDELNADQNRNLLENINTKLATTTTQKDFSSSSEVVASNTVKYAAIAIVVASLCILLYISFTFRKMPKPFSWGICAIIALVFNVLVVAGIFSLLGKFADVEVDALFITGMLTVVGYSVHDTIVVFDRIRENLSHSSGSFENVVNSSIIQTIIRSLNTSLTILFVLVALFLLGGPTIRNFVLVLIIGCIAGTYSSICNASQFLIVVENKEYSRLNPFRKRNQGSLSEF
ncbi:MAG: protein translocase subunit SecF [Dehalococcoidia bacterium]|nr:protein translocase subunit SecF [Dehalococcoidia bacterium]